MAVPAKALRMALLAAAILLIAVLLGFIGYARLRSRSYLAGLQKRLGISIKQEADNVTYSQSYKGRTVFTVHAAKQIQREDGKYTLRDVGIVLNERGSDRVDRIHGSEFEYDPKAGVLRAVGEVFLDLAPPSAQPGNKPGGDADADIIHVKTSGLVYLQKQGTASTTEPVDFMAHGMTGHSVGASYASQGGVVVLETQVRVSGIERERPFLLTATHAELDRTGNLLQLAEARYVQEGDPSEQTFAADRALMHLTPAGSPQRLDAEGHVTLTRQGQGARRGSSAARATSERMDAAFGDGGRMQLAHLAGSVHFAGEAPGRSDHGVADDARVLFDDLARPVHTTLTGAVNLAEKTASDERTLGSARLELALGGGGRERSFLRAAEAMGAPGAPAILRLVHADAAGRSSTEVKAPRLAGRFRTTGGVTQLVGLDGAGQGSGQTRLERVTLAPGGALLLRDTSAGDTLTMDFRDTGKGRTELARAVQTGGVSSTREAAAKKPGAAVEIEHAKAAQATYDASMDRVAMSGGVEVYDQSSELFADRVSLDRGKGEGEAEGAVRVSYLQAGSASAEPVHVTAARAVGLKSTGVTEFFAAPGGRARMWQGGSQVEAPEIDFDRTGRRVIAHGGAVRAVLVGAPNRQGVATPVRIAATEMTYVDQTRVVELAGPVRVESQDGVMLAREATAYLAPAQASGQAPGLASTQGFPAGKLERVVGTGQVEVTQPGRKATGEKLVYTAADGLFVMTGTRAAPPKMIDEARGTVTGSTLRFHTGEDSVEVLGGDGGRVRTETRTGTKP